MATAKLTDLQCRNAKAKEDSYRLSDGGGLALLIKSDGGKYWQFRYTKPDGREGLSQIGTYTSYPLAKARERATELRVMVRDGIDPAVAKKVAKATASLEQAKAVTFKEACAKYIAAHRTGWKNPKHVQQWENTLATYAFPIIGGLLPRDIDTGLVLKVLEPIWATKNETASRLRGRIESVLSWCKVRGLRESANPAQWRGHLDQLLPAPAKVQRATSGNHPALPYAEMAGFMRLLKAQTGLGALALELTILTAARTGEVIGAKWSEIDKEKAIWTIPAERMKAGKAHAVALSKQALALLTKLEDMPRPAGNDYLFAGRGQKSISNMAMLQLLKRMKCAGITVHGFRSSFRDWAAEMTAYPSDVVEMALAHTIENKVEAAYRRGDLLEKRRRLMQEWAEFCDKEVAQGVVTPLRKAG